MPIYSAGEKQIKKISSKSFCRHLKKRYKDKSVSIVTNERQFFEELKQMISPGDNVIFLGAGKSSAIAEKFCNYSGFKS